MRSLPYWRPRRTSDGDVAPPVTDISLWEDTPLTTPELHFIRTSRDRILKRGAFDAYAIVTESSTGEDSNPVITNISYELAHYDEAGERHDLEKPIRDAINWCDQQLTAIEAKLRPVYDARSE